MLTMYSRFTVSDESCSFSDDDSVLNVNSNEKNNNNTSAFTIHTTAKYEVASSIPDLLEAFREYEERHPNLKLSACIPCEKEKGLLPNKASELKAKIRSGIDSIINKSTTPNSTNDNKNKLDGLPNRNERVDRRKSKNKKYLNFQYRLNTSNPEDTFCVLESIDSDDNISVISVSEKRPCGCC